MTSLLYTVDHTYCIQKFVVTMDSHVLELKHRSSSVILFVCI